MQQKERTGPVGHLREAGAAAALTEKGGLLVSDDSRDRDFRPEMLATRHPEVAGAGTHFRQDADRHLEHAGELRIPGLCAQVVQESAGCVGVVRGVHGSPGQAGHEPGVDRAGGEISGFRRRPEFRVLAKEPGQLGSREIRIQDQPRSVAHVRLMTASPQLRADRRRAAILPDDCPARRRQRDAIPEHHGLPLVRDADGLHADAVPGRAQRRARNPHGHPPDLLGVVLHPAGSGEVLGELRIAATQDASVARHHQRGRARRPLVECQNRRRPAHNATPLPGFTRAPGSFPRSPKPKGAPASANRRTSSGMGRPTTVK